MMGESRREREGRTERQLDRDKLDTLKSDDLEGRRKDNSFMKSGRPLYLVGKIKRWVTNVIVGLRIDRCKSDVAESREK